MREFGREERVGSEIHKALASLLFDEIRDPRLNNITILEVRVVRDLSYARIFYTLTDKNLIPNVEQALKKASTFLRKRLGEMIKLRNIPNLNFEYDYSMERGAKLSSLIDKAINSENMNDAKENNKQKHKE
tara:strand:+ start:74 stop:466 length:393 start_codon:yes stop_codon:yes gene_type:complete